MSSPMSREIDSATEAGGIDASGEFELRHILDVAGAYLDAGHIDDADDLLQEALEADANHPDVMALARRLAHARGEPPASHDPGPVIHEPTASYIVNFTRPLPEIDSRPRTIQRLATTAEAHYAANRLISALDLTHVMCAEAPDFLPGFVRLAELQLALGHVDSARDLFKVLKRRYSFEDMPSNWLVDALGISLNPGDTSALIGYAMVLIDSGDASVLDPFVPEAIARAVDMNVSAALDLADRYLKLKPADDSAKRLYLTVLTAAGNVTKLVEAARSMVTRQSAPELLAVRVAAEIAAGNPDWLEWHETLVAAIRANPERCSQIAQTWDSVNAGESPDAMALALALVHHAAGRWAECLATLDTLDTDHLASARERFVALFTRATAYEREGDPRATSLLLESARQAYAPDIESFARSTTIFGVSAAPTEMLRAFALHDDGDLSLQALIELRDANPSRLDIRSALADALLAGGNVNEAVREWRFVAQESERKSNLPGMIDAMRHISKAVPGNIEMKAKLIEGYLRRGVLDEAVGELELIAGLYLERDRQHDAVAAYTRAAEIASTLGDFGRGNDLFDRAVLADPDNVPVRHAAVAFYLQTGAIDNAAQQLREVVRIALTVNDLDEAVAALHQIIALAPQDASVYHKLGEVLTALGEYTQAERVYRRLATITPDDPVLEAKQSALAVLAATN